MEPDAAIIGNVLSDDVALGNDHVAPDNSARADVPVTRDNAVTRDTSLLSQSRLGIDLMAELHNKYSLDPTYQSILARPKEFRNFEVDGHLIYLKDKDKRVLCIPKVQIQGRSTCEIVISEAHSMLAHLGPSKTLDYLRDHMWWKDMVPDVKSFCETCHTCKTSKPSNQKPYGLLNPLSVPSYPLEWIS